MRIYLLGNPRLCDALGMKRIVNFYMDDSGTRRPDRVPTAFDPESPKYFALGGVLVLEEDEPAVRTAHEALCQKWSIDYPLHSEPIRHGTGDFSWLRRESPEYKPFMRDLTAMLTSIPVLGLACAIDRPGYDSRYRKRYGRNQWQLCKTACSIVIERAAKYARSMGRVLRVLAEKSCKDDEKRIRAYFDHLRTSGAPFDPSKSATYTPLAAAECGETLIELRFKQKTSPPMQIADLYLWPIAVERYRTGGRSYAHLRDSSRLIECLLSAAEVSRRATKYSCFELVDALRRGSETTKA
jgi:hypothetical protein